MYKYFLNWKVLLLGIIILAAILRFWQLGTVPAGFHSDEAAWGYNAYSILNTGADEYGVKYPLILESFGEYKGVVYTYLAIPFIYILGLDPFAARIPSVIFSLLSLVVLFFITKELTKKTNIALVVAGLYAVLPWSINLSRVVADFNLAFFFTLTSIYALLKLKNHFSFLWFSVGVLASILSIFSYTASRFYALIIIVIFLFASIRFLKNKLTFNKSFLSMLILVFIAGMVYTNFGTATRFSQVSIFSTPETQLSLNEQIREDQFRNPQETRFFHNKLFNYTRTILSNYSLYMTLDYNFLSGGYPLREKIPDSGLFYIWQLPFLLFGIYLLVRRRDFLTYLLFAWYFLLLIPSIITFDESPNIHRSLVVLPPLLITISLGIVKTFEFIKTKRIKQFVMVALIIIASCEFLYFLHQYFVHFNVHQPWHRGYAYMPLADSLKEVSDDYKKIVITKGHSSPYISLLFFNKYDPQKYQQEGSLRDTDYQGFSKYYFVPEHCFLGEGKKQIDGVATGSAVLYVVRGECKIPKKFKVIHTVRWQDNTAAFQLVEYK